MSTLCGSPTSCRTTTTTHRRRTHTTGAAVLRGRADHLLARGGMERLGVEMCGGSRVRQRVDAVCGHRGGANVGQRCHRVRGACGGSRLRAGRGVGCLHHGVAVAALVGPTVVWFLAVAAVATARVAAATRGGWCDGGHGCGAREEHPQKKRRRRKTATRAEGEQRQTNERRCRGVAPRYFLLTPRDAAAAAPQSTAEPPPPSRTPRRRRPE